MNALKVLNMAKFCRPLAQSRNRMPVQQLTVSHNLQHDLLASPNTSKSTNHCRNFSTITIQSSGLAGSASSAIRLSQGFTQPLVRKVTARYMSSASSKIDRLIKNNKVVVFSKSYCPFCTATKNLFKALDVEIEVLELDLMGNEGVELQNSLFDKTNQRSVPNVFVNGNHVGGNDDTQQAARNGTLQELLK